MAFIDDGGGGGFFLLFPIILSFPKSPRRAEPSRSQSPSFLASCDFTPLLVGSHSPTSCVPHSTANWFSSRLLPFPEIAPAVSIDLSKFRVLFCFLFEFSPPDMDVARGTRKTSSVAESLPGQNSSSDDVTQNLTELSALNRARKLRRLRSASISLSTERAARRRRCRLDRWNRS